MDNTHVNACRAVVKNCGMPMCDDRFLSAAKEEGLIEFHAWPSGHWALTGKGKAYLSERDFNY